MLLFFGFFELHLRHLAKVGVRHLGRDRQNDFFFGVLLEGLAALRGGARADAPEVAPALGLLPEGAFEDEEDLEVSETFPRRFRESMDGEWRGRDGKCGMRGGGMGGGQWGGEIGCGMYIYTHVYTQRGPPTLLSGRDGKCGMWGGEMGGKIKCDINQV